MNDDTGDRVGRRSNVAHCRAGKLLACKRRGERSYLSRFTVSRADATIAPDPWERHVPEIICFGPFELDARTGELRKRGKRIRLAPQPASLLTLLATRPGQLVTRDEICRHLWGGGVFVEYRAIAERVPRASQSDTRRPRGRTSLYRNVSPAWLSLYRPGSPVAAIPATDGRRAAVGQPHERSCARVPS